MLMANLCKYSVAFIFLTLFLFITFNNTEAQLLNKHNFGLKQPDTSQSFNEKNTYLYFGLGAYKFLDLYLFSVELMPGIGQKVYFGFGLDIYGKIKKEENVIRPYASFTFSATYNLKLKKINMFFGPGLAYYYYYIAPVFLVKVNYKISRDTEAGFEIKSVLFRNGDIAKDAYYILSPVLKINLSLKL